jgi:hypothetical protein
MGESRENLSHVRRQSEDEPLTQRVALAIRPCVVLHSGAVGDPPWQEGLRLVAERDVEGGRRRCAAVPVAEAGQEQLVYNHDATVTSPVPQTVGPVGERHEPGVAAARQLARAEARQQTPRALHIHQQALASDAEGESVHRLRVGPVPAPAGDHTVTDHACLQTAPGPGGGSRPELPPPGLHRWSTVGGNAYGLQGRAAPGRGPPRLDVPQSPVRGPVLVGKPAVRVLVAEPEASGGGLHPIAVAG